MFIVEKTRQYCSADKMAASLLKRHGSVSLPMQKPVNEFVLKKNEEKERGQSFIAGKTRQWIYCWKDGVVITLLKMWLIVSLLNWRGSDFTAERRGSNFIAERRGSGFTTETPAVFHCRKDGAVFHCWKIGRISSLKKTRRCFIAERTGQCQPWCNS